jgi:hypothetical protein
VAVPILVFWKVKKIAFGSLPTRRDVWTLADEMYLTRQCEKERKGRQYFRMRRKRYSIFGHSDFVFHSFCLMEGA